MPPIHPEAVLAQSASWDDLPTKQRPLQRSSQVIAEAYDRIASLRTRGYDWDEIAELVQQTFSLELAPKTIANYWYRADRQRQADRSRRISPNPRKRSPTAGREPRPSAKTPMVLDPDLSQPVMAPTTIPEAIDPVPSALATKTVEAIDPVPSPPSTQPTKASTQRSLPSGQPPESSAPVLLSEELETDLAIPDPQDEQAVQRFLGALAELKTIDPNRWRITYSAAIDADVNVTGTQVLPAARRHAKFNQY
jgi:hypothetical protein